MKVAMLTPIDVARQNSSLIRASVFLLIAATSAPAQVFTGLGTPLNEGVATTPAGISDRVPVVIGVNQSDAMLPIPSGEPFRWTKPAGLESLGLLPNAVSGMGDLVSGDGTAIAGRNYFHGEPRAYTSQAFVWTKRDGLVAVPFLPGGSCSNSIAGLSDSGEVLVGSSESAVGFQAFVWTRSTGTTGLGCLPGKTYSVGQGISADGTVIVGQSGRPGSPQTIEGFRWTKQEGMTGLGFLPGMTEDDALSVSADGQVIIGTTYGGDCNGQAFRWTRATGIVGLGFLPGQNYSFARALSADGSVVAGDAQVSWRSPARQAFRWTESGGMVGLGFLSGGGNYSIVLGLSDDGTRLAGASDSAEGIQAYLWTEAEGMRSVRDVLVNDYGVDLAGWTLLAATLSADGQTLTGRGLNPSGQEEGWVADLHGAQVKSRKLKEAAR